MHVSNRVASRTVLRLLIAVLAASALFAEAAPKAVAHDGIHEQLAELSRQIRAKAGDASLYLRRGELYRIHRDWAAAAADFERARRLDPNLRAVDLARGRLLADVGNFDEAERCLDRYIAAEPESSEALLVRARLLVRMKRPADAVADFTRAIALMSEPDPDHFVERAHTSNSRA